MINMERREELLQELIKNFVNDLSTSVRPFSQEESIKYIGILIDYLKGIFNHEPAAPEYDYEGNPFDEDEFIEKNLLEPYREKMIPFVKTSLRYYFSKDEFNQSLLFQKLRLGDETLNEEEYQQYILRLYVILRNIKQNLYLRPIENTQDNTTNNSVEAQKLIDSPDELKRQGFKSKSKEYTRIRQMLLFYFLLKLTGMTRLDSSARKYAQFAHVLFYYPTNNIDGSEVYKMIKQAPYLKEKKSLLKDLEFIKQQFELIESKEGIALVQKEIDLIYRK